MPESAVVLAIQHLEKHADKRLDSGAPGVDGVVFLLLDELYYVRGFSSYPFEFLITESLPLLVLVRLRLPVRLRVPNDDRVSSHNYLLVVRTLFDHVGVIVKSASHIPHITGKRKHKLSIDE
mgnify:CR=1 FL=1